MDLDVIKTGIRHNAVSYPRFYICVNISAHHILHFVDCMSDIVAHVLVLKLHPLCCLISIRASFFEVFAECGHAEHSSSICHNASVLIELCTGMESIVAPLRS